MTALSSQHRDANISDAPAGLPLLASRPLIHIGLRKTGSTWLRKKLFGRADTGFLTSSDTEASGKSRLSQYTRQLVMDDIGRLIPDEDFDPAVLRKQLEPLVVPPGRCAVFYSARLGGHPL